MKKDDGLNDALAGIMGFKADPQQTPTRPTAEAQRTHSGPTTEAQQTPREAVKVRFDSGDYDRLKAIAADQGTTAAALVRLAVKQYLRGMK
jgi:hypothetical protein